MQGHPLFPVVAVVAAFTLVAGVIHQVSSLPARYDWLGPLDLLLSRWHQPWFPSLLFGALALGAATRPEAARAAAGRVGRRKLLAALAVATLGAVVDRLTSPEHTAGDALALVGAGIGVAVLWPADRKPARAVGDLLLVLLCFTLVSYGFTVIKALLFATRTPRDAQMIALEAALLGVAPHRAIAGWASAHPGWVRLFDDVYFRLFDHMVVASAFLMGAGRVMERWRLLGALGLCYVLGAGAYYLWPGLGPAFHEPERFAFLTEQGGLQTGIAQRLLALNTEAAAAGHAFELHPYAYVACMPSLHIAHELVMLWYARASRTFFAISAAFTALTIASTFVLGWHYPIDALGGAALAAAAIALAGALVGRTPRTAAPTDRPAAGAP